MGLGLEIQVVGRLGEGRRCSRVLGQVGLEEAFALEQLTTLFKLACKTVRAPFSRGPRSVSLTPVSPALPTLTNLIDSKNFRYHVWQKRGSTLSAL